MTPCRTKTETVSRMEKIGSFNNIVIVAISQWRRRLSAHVKAHGGHFEHIS